MMFCRIKGSRLRVVQCCDPSMLACLQLQHSTDSPYVDTPRTCDGFQTVGCLCCDSAQQLALQLLMGNSGLACFDHLGVMGWFCIHLCQGCATWQPCCIIDQLDRSVIYHLLGKYRQSGPLSARSRATSGELCVQPSSLSRCTFAVLRLLLLLRHLAAGEDRVRVLLAEPLRVRGDGGVRLVAQPPPLLAPCALQQSRRTL